MPNKKAQKINKWVIAIIAGGFLLTNLVSFLIGGFVGYQYCKSRVIKYLNQVQESLEQQSSTDNSEEIDPDNRVSPSDFINKQDYHGI